MVYPIAKYILPPFFKMWVKEANGLDNLPEKGACIIASNHASYLDHFIIGAYIVTHRNRKFHFLSKKEHFDNPIKAAWHSYLGAIPLDRQKGGKEGLRQAIKELKRGKLIVIHPEGTRSLTGNLLRGKTGIARLALAAKVPVLPIGLIGTFEVLPKGKYIPKAKKAVMNIGKPMSFEKYYGKRITKQLLGKITTKIMKEIAKLSNQRYDFD